MTEEEKDEFEELNRRMNSVKRDKNLSCGCTTTCIAVIAFCVSWSFNHSILWGIFHFFLGPIYLAYKAIWYVFFQN